MSTTTPPRRTSEPGTGAEAPVDRVTWGLAVANLAAQIAIIVTGGAVRLTGSGLGCSQWPMCEPGSFTPVFHEATTIHPFIEFGNRTMTGVLTVVALALLWAVYRRGQVPAVVRTLTWTVLGLIAVQALIGGITVWVELHAAIVGSHMLLSLALVAVSAYLLVRLGRGGATAVPLLAGPARALPWVLAGLLTLVVALGTVVTGAGPHSGDVERGFRYAVDPLLVTRAHSESVWLFLAAVVVGAVLIRRAPELSAARRAWVWLVAAVLVEGAIGYTQYFTGLPALLVGFHMLGAALLVTATTFACSALYGPRAAGSAPVTPALAGEAPTA